MAYLKRDSVPAMQEIQSRRACQIIRQKSVDYSHTHRKSYVIESTLERDTSQSPLPYPFNKPFGRG